jgi:hypothetical protein
MGICSRAGGEACTGYTAIMETLQHNHREMKAKAEGQAVCAKIIVMKTQGVGDNTFV